MVLVSFKGDRRSFQKKNSYRRLSSVKTQNRLFFFFKSVMKTSGTSLTINRWEVT